MPATMQTGTRARSPPGVNTNSARNNDGSQQFNRRRWRVYLPHCFRYLFPFLSSPPSFPSTLRLSVRRFLAHAVLQHINIGRVLLFT